MDKRTLEKYEREAREKNRETWYLSWALDTNQEERDKVSESFGLELRTNNISFLVSKYFTEQK